MTAREQAAVCPTHDTPLVTEPGGPDAPTVHGRRYCPTCQGEVVAALDARAALGGES